MILTLELRSKLVYFVQNQHFFALSLSFFPVRFFNRPWSYSISLLGLLSLTINIINFSLINKNKAKVFVVPIHIYGSDSFYDGTQCYLNGIIIKWLIKTDFYIFCLRCKVLIEIYHFCLVPGWLLSDQICVPCYFSIFSQVKCWWHKRPSNSLIMTTHIHTF